MSRKSINLTNEDDVQQWKRIKLSEIERRDDPDLGDVELLRDLMDEYEGDTDNDD